mmetsp:Transcript_8846/g.25962  ORF Transcript_8846/g.25962 Transcript_8846/m.25962 type:complete len:204 (-) Transcript_8846:246-857(-)
MAAAVMGGEATVEVETAAEMPPPADGGVCSDTPRSRRPPGSILSILSSRGRWGSASRPRASRDQSHRRLTRRSTSGCPPRSRYTCRVGLDTRSGLQWCCQPCDCTSHRRRCRNFGTRRGQSRGCRRMRTAPAIVVARLEAWVEKAAAARVAAGVVAQAEAARAGARAGRGRVAAGWWGTRRPPCARRSTPSSPGRGCTRPGSC